MKTEQIWKNLLANRLTVIVRRSAKLADPVGEGPVGRLVLIDGNGVALVAVKRKPGHPKYERWPLTEMRLTRTVG